MDTLTTLQLCLVYEIMTAFHANEVPEMLASLLGDEARCRYLVQAVCNRNPSILVGFIVLTPHLPLILGGNALFIYKYGASSKYVVINEAVKSLLTTNASLDRYDLHRNINGGIHNVYTNIEHIRCQYFGNYNPIHEDAL
jgi:hypothetical protein